MIFVGCYFRLIIILMEQSTLNFIYFLAIVGGLFFAVFLAKLLWALIKSILPQKNYAQRYGAGSWVIVTGGSDGIGLGFCEQFAALGFNICMIARNEKKMEGALRQIVRNCQQHKIQTQYVTADFAECQKDKFFVDLFQRIKARGVLDNCSILVNNVGISNIGYIHEISDQRLLNEININCVPMVLMTNYIIPYMLKRERRSAIINVSSFAAEHPVPYVSTYSATKAFNNFFSQAVGMEYENQIDVISLRPMLVESNMSKQKASCSVATRTQCTQAAIKYLGLDYETNGYWVHRLFSTIVGWLPVPLIRGMSESESRKIMEKQNPKKQDLMGNSEQVRIK